METKTIKQKIFVQGHSLCISIPYRAVKNLKLKKGDFVEAKIKKA